MTAFSNAFSSVGFEAQPAPQTAFSRAFEAAAFNAILGRVPPFADSAFSGFSFDTGGGGAPDVPDVEVSFVALYPVPSLHAGVRYISGAARPLAGTVRSAFQQADRAETGWDAVVQDADRLPTGVTSRYQDAAPLEADIAQHGREALRVRDEGYVRFQDALRLAALNSHIGWRDGRKARHARQVDYQDALRLPARFAGDRFQDAVSHRGRYDMGYQDALPVEVSAGFFFATASPRIFVRHSRYQDAAAMQVGVSEHPVVDPTDPGGPGDGEPVIVPVREVYVVLNNCFLRRVDGNVFLPTFDMSLSLDCDSWTWSFSASLPISAFDDVRPDSDGTPVEVETSINGVPYRWLVEERSRNRQFPETRFSIGGRGISARLASPGAPVLNFGNDEARTGQQLMADVLTLNGVPLDWDVEWGIDDWNQPPNLWTKQGTYAEALTEIAEAVGAYIQPTRATQGIRVLPRYPSLPRDWPDVTEYLQLPEDAVTVESTAWEQKPRYNRVYISGTTGGVVGRVTIAGTDGAMIAPDVSSPLIGDATAARMRGQRVLGETGHVATYGLRTAVGLRDEDNQPIGVVVPGRFIRYIENGVPKIGLSRAVKVDIDPVEVWQTISVEVHEDVESV